MNRLFSSFRSGAGLISWLPQTLLAFGLLFWGSPVSAQYIYTITAPENGAIKRIYISPGETADAGKVVGLFQTEEGKTIEMRLGVGGTIRNVSAKQFQKMTKGETIAELDIHAILTNSPTGTAASGKGEAKNIGKELFKSTGISAIWEGQLFDWKEGAGRVIMYLIALGLLYLGIRKKFEPLLLVPIATGCLLSNIPGAGIAEEGGLLKYAFDAGITTGIFPLLIFLGVGAMTDFGPMIANPVTALLGGAAQFAIFGTLLGAVALNSLPGFNFTIQEAGSIAIIGGADGPTSIFLAGKLAPHLLGPIAVAAYSYMALVPIIQPPIIRLLTSEKERAIKMVQLRHVSKREKIIFPIMTLTAVALLLPSAAPLLGMLMFGNLLRECGVTERLNDTAQNALINIVTIFLGLAVGSKLSADKFLAMETLGIISLGLFAFCLGTAAGVMMGKVLNMMVKSPINPIIGAAGVSAVPMAARVANKVGLEANPQNHLLMHAMGPNVSGVIGSAIAAGVLLAVL